MTTPSNYSLKGDDKAAPARQLKNLTKKDGNIPTAIKRLRAADPGWPKMAYSRTFTDNSMAYDAMDMMHDMHYLGLASTKVGAYLTTKTRNIVANNTKWASPSTEEIPKFYKHVKSIYDECMRLADDNDKTGITFFYGNVPIIPVKRARAARGSKTTTTSTSASVSRLGPMISPDEDDNHDDNYEVKVKTEDGMDDKQKRGDGKAGDKKGDHPVAPTKKPNVVIDDKSEGAGDNGAKQAATTRIAFPAPSESSDHEETPSTSIETTLWATLRRLEDEQEEILDEDRELINKDNDLADQLSDAYASEKPVNGQAYHKLPDVTSQLPCGKFKGNESKAAMAALQGYKLWPTHEHHLLKDIVKFQTDDDNLTNVKNFAKRLLVVSRLEIKARRVRELRADNYSRQDDKMKQLRRARKTFSGKLKHILILHKLASRYRKRGNTTTDDKIPKIGALPKFNMPSADAPADKKLIGRAASVSRDEVLAIDDEIRAVAPPYDKKTFPVSLPGDFVMPSADKLCAGKRVRSVSQPPRKKQKLQHADK
jgi:hypothetical protein